MPNGFAELWREQKIDGKGGIHCQAEGHAEPCHCQAGPIEKRPQAVLIGDCVDSLVAKFMVQQISFAADGPQQVEEDGDDEVAQIVEDGHVSGVVAVEHVDGGGHEGGWIRDEDDAEEQQQIGGHEQVVGFSDVDEKAMVVDPHDADEEKAEYEAHVAGPLLGDADPKGDAGCWMF